MLNLLLSGFHIPLWQWGFLHIEPFFKCPLLLQFKAGSNFNHRNTSRIPPVKI